MSLRQLHIAILIFYCSYFNSNIDSINQNLVLVATKPLLIKWNTIQRWSTAPYALHHTKQQDKKIQHYLWTAPKKIASYHNWGWQQTKPQVSLLRLCSRPCPALGRRSSLHLFAVFDLNWNSNLDFDTDDTSWEKINNSTTA